jgi:AcrR family transcriptional regulator
MSNQTRGATGRRERRTTAEVERLMLGAAQDLFCAQGYAATSFRAVAERADVAESVLYRKFRTKAALFDQAVVEPFRQVIDAYASDYGSRPPVEWDNETLARNFIETLYDFLVEHQRLGRALINAFLIDTPGTDRLESPFNEVLTKVEEVGRTAGAASGLTGLDPARTVRVLTGITMSMALLGDLFFAPDATRPPRQRIVDEMVALCAYGETGRPDRAP